MNLNEMMKLINEVMSDPDKAQAVMDIIAESDNDSVKEMLSELWTMLIMVHGEEIAQAFEQVDAEREQAKRDIERRMARQDLEEEMKRIRKESDWEKIFNDKLRESIKDEYKKKLTPKGPTWAVGTTVTDMRQDYYRKLVQNDLETINIKNEDDNERYYRILSEAVVNASKTHNLDDLQKLVGAKHGK